MKTLVATLFCFFTMQSIAQTTVAHKPTFEYTDTVFYEGQVMVKYKILFGCHGWDVCYGSLPILDSLITFMKYHTKIIMEVGHHSDSRASKQFNIDLSYKRALSVVDYILSQGIDPSRITAKGYGESMPLNKCVDGVKCTEEEHQQNRRTEFKIISIAQ